jgi:Cupin-like domain
MDRTPPLDPITELLTTYNELNSTHIDTLSSPPSALEFLRFVARNRPFVVRGGASDWEATRTWDIETLKRLLEGQSIQVAVTPHGYLYPFPSLIDRYITRRYFMLRNQKRRRSNQKPGRRTHLRQAVGRTTVLFTIHRFHLRTRTSQPLITSLRSPLRANPFVSRDSLRPLSSSLPLLTIA